jgi:ribonucleoside-diphosphate reductase beta chain
MKLPDFGQIVSMSDRRLIGGPPTQTLFPVKYPYLWAAYKAGIANNWTPQEIQMSQDKFQYHTELSDNERRQYDWCFSMLTTMDQFTMGVLEKEISRHFTTPEGEMWTARQAYEESLHTEAYQYCIETFGFNPEEVYTRFLKEKALYNKIAYTKNWHDLLAGADCTTLQGKRDFVKGYGGWALGLEGGWFRMGFSLVFALARNQKMSNTAEQFQYILRDEILHMHTGLKTLQVTQEEYPEVWDDETVMWFTNMMKEVFLLEADFIREACLGVLSFSPSDYLEHFRFTMNSYAFRLGIPAPFPGAAAAMTWLDEMSGAWRKEKNFFETRVTEYQTASSLVWDDDDQAP